MRWLSFSALVLLVVWSGVEARIHNGKSRHQRSDGTFENNHDNINPYEVVSMDGQSPIRFHSTECGKVLREIAVLHPVDLEQEEFVLKRILIEDDTGKPANGPCADALLEAYEKEDAKRPTFFLKRRTGGGVAPPAYPPAPSNNEVDVPLDLQPIQPAAGFVAVNLDHPAPYPPPFYLPQRPRRKCAWNRIPDSPSPFSRRRDCRRRREPPRPQPCGSQPWRSETPCKPALPNAEFGEFRRPQEEVMPVPVMVPMPPRTGRKCSNRGPLPLPIRRNCRNRLAPMTPHSSYGEAQKVKREWAGLDHHERERLLPRQTHDMDAMVKMIDLNDHTLRKRPKPVHVLPVWKV